MSGPDTLSQAFGTLLLALAFSAFIVFVRGYRPGGVSGAWYDLVLAFVAVWLAFWPEAGVLARSPKPGQCPGVGLAGRRYPARLPARLRGGKGIAAGDAGNPAKKIGFFAGESARFVAEISRKHI